MTQEEKLNVIDRIHNLIRRKGTGKPCQLADRLSLSERTVYNLIQEMKRMSAPIYFCQERNSYCYEYEVEFVIGFMTKKDYDDKYLDLKKITGGKTNLENNYQKYFSLQEFLQ